MKVVINKTYGGFSVTKEVFKELNIKRNGYGFLHSKDFGIDSKNSYQYRTDNRLIKAIQKIGEEASSGDHTELRVISIPDDVEWDIEEYDGAEWVAEAHRCWS